MAHSPGPWLAHVDHHRRNPRRRMALVATSNGRISIDATGSGETYSQDCANARLIAAAPDLLAACRFALETFAGANDDERAVFLAAIAKAEGRA